MAYQPGVYKTSGGDEQVIASSGVQRVQSGGTFTMESGATLTLAGQAVTSTGAGTFNSVTSTGTITGNAFSSTGTSSVAGGYTSTGASFSSTGSGTAAKFDAVTSTGTGTFNAVTSTGTGTFNAVSSTGTGSFNAVTSTGTGTFNAVTSTGTGTFNAVSSTGAGTFDSITTTGGTAGTIKGNQVTANLGYVSYIETLTTASTQIAGYGISHVTVTTSGHLFALAAPVTGMYKWISVVTTTTLTISSSEVGADIAGSTQISITTGSLTSPAWIHLAGRNSTSWTALGMSANVSIS